MKQVQTIPKVVLESLPVDIHGHRVLLCVDLDDNFLAPNNVGNLSWEISGVNLSILYFLNASTKKLRFFLSSGQLGREVPSILYLSIALPPNVLSRGSWPLGCYWASSYLMGACSCWRWSSCHTRGRASFLLLLCYNIHVFLLSAFQNCERHHYCFIWRKVFVPILRDRIQ